MAKYRKRPVVIEAVQFDPHVHPWPDGVICPSDGSDIGSIQTLEGEMTVIPDDWVITGIKGEKYSCKDDIFQMTYEAVEG